MRALTWILVPGLIALWTYFGSEIDRPADRPVRVAADAAQGETDAGTLNNRGVTLFEQGDHADALAYFERAHQFRPDAQLIEKNYRGQLVRVRREAWERALVLLTIVAVVLLFFGHTWRGARCVRDHRRLKRLRLHGGRRVHVGPDTKEEQLDLRFNESVDGLARRHPPSVVWTCSEQNQHMKSRRSVKVKDRDCTITLDRKKIKQLRRYPGHWRCIVRLGKTEVGEAAARVG